MASDIEFSGPGIAKLQRKIAALDRAAAGGLTRDLTAGLIAGAKPLPAIATAAAQRLLPGSGGFADRIAQHNSRVEPRLGRNPTVVVVYNGRDSWLANEGTISHPVFGRPPIVRQQIRPGWFTITMRNAAPKVRPALEAAMHRVAQKVERA